MITVRKARANDVETLLALWKEYWPEHTKIVVSKHPKVRPHVRTVPDAPAKVARWLRQVVRSRKAVAFLADVDGAAAGFATVSAEKNLRIYAIRRFAYLGILFVRKDRRRKGISRMLTRAAVEWARERKLGYLSLHVTSGNQRAEAIYRKWGFVEVSLEMRKRI